MSFKILFKQIYRNIKSQWKFLSFLFLFLSISLSLIMGLLTFGENFNQHAVVEILKNGHSPMSKFGSLNTNIKFKDMEPDEKELVFSKNFEDKLLEDWTKALKDEDKNSNFVFKISDLEGISQEDRWVNQFIFTISKSKFMYKDLEETTFWFTNYKYVNVPPIEKIKEFAGIYKKLVLNYLKDSSILLQRTFNISLDKESSAHSYMNGIRMIEGKTSQTDFPNPNDKPSFLITNVKSENYNFENMSKVFKDLNYTPTPGVMEIYTTEKYVASHPDYINKIFSIAISNNVDTKFKVKIAGFIRNNTEPMDTIKKRRFFIDFNDFYNLYKYDGSQNIKPFNIYKILESSDAYSENFIGNIKKANVTNFKKAKQEIVNDIYNSKIFINEKDIIEKGVNDVSGTTAGMPVNISLIFNSIFVFFIVLITVLTAFLIKVIQKEQIETSKTKLSFLKAMGLSDFSLTLFNMFMVFIPFILALSVTIPGMSYVQNVFWNIMRDEYAFEIPFWDHALLIWFYFIGIIVLFLIMFFIVNYIFITRSVGTTTANIQKLGWFEMFLLKAKRKLKIKNRGSSVSTAFNIQNFGKNIVTTLILGLTFGTILFSTQFLGSVDATSREITESQYPYTTTSSASSTLISKNGKGISSRYEANKTIQDVKDYKEIFFDFSFKDFLEKDESDLNVVLPPKISSNPFLDVQSLDSFYISGKSFADFDDKLCRDLELRNLTGKTVNITTTINGIKINKDIKKTLTDKDAAVIKSVFLELCGIRHTIQTQYSNANLDEILNISLGVIYNPNKESEILPTTVLKTSVFGFGAQSNLIEVTKSKYNKKFGDQLKNYTKTRDITKKLQYLTFYDKYLIYKQLHINLFEDNKNFEEEEFTFEVPLVPVISNSDFKDLNREYLNPIVNFSNKNALDGTFINMPIYLDVLQTTKKTPLDNNNYFYMDRENFLDRFVEYSEDISKFYKDVIEKGKNIDEDNSLATRYKNASNLILNEKLKYKIPYESLSNNFYSNDEIPFILKNYWLSNEHLIDFGIDPENALLNYVDSYKENEYNILDFEIIRKIFDISTKSYTDVVDKVKNIFIIVSIIVVFILMSIIIRKNKIIIVLLKAMGYTKRQVVQKISWGYILASIIGIGIAILISWLGLHLISLRLEDTIRIVINFKWSWQFILSIIILPLTFITFVELFVLYTTRKLRAKDAFNYSE